MIKGRCAAVAAASGTHCEHMTIYGTYEKQMNNKKQKKKKTTFKQNKLSGKMAINYGSKKEGNTKIN